VQRVFLGVLESSISPGFVLITSQWYKKSEQAARLGVWYSATGIFSAFSGIVNYGLGSADGSFAPWKRMYCALASSLSLSPRRAIRRLASRSLELTTLLARPPRFRRRPHHRLCVRRPLRRARLASHLAALVQRRRAADPDPALEGEHERAHRARRVQVAPGEGGGLRRQDLLVHVHGRRHLVRRLVHLLRRSECD